MLGFVVGWCGQGDFGVLDTGDFLLRVGFGCLCELGWFLVLCFRGFVAVLELRVWRLRGVFGWVSAWLFGGS